jgi:transcriptional regulator with XRE-family HTH domain
MSFTETNIDGRISARIRDLRAQRGLNLETLASRANVSRAMLSRIERGESSPTAQLLNKVCGGLGITLSEFFAETERPPRPLARFADQPTWRDPESRYLRRNVSPAATGSTVDIVETNISGYSTACWNYSLAARPFASRRATVSICASASRSASATRRRGRVATPSSSAGVER